MMSARRDGVVFDQCGACRGIFLAESDLTWLIESAATATGAVPSAVPSTVPAAAAPPNGYARQVYEGRHRRD
jgi:Zn-finger nucleic acid-binding protein